LRIMSSKEELEKLNVAQLRDRLKQRKLPISGNKPDLVQRLHDDIAAEDKLLGGSGHESAGPSDIDLSGVNVDEVLGLDPESVLLSPTAQQHKVPAEPTPPKVQKPQIQSPVAQSPKKTVQPAAPAKVKGVEPNNNAPSAQAEKAKLPVQELVKDLDKKIQLKAVARMGLPVGADGNQKEGEGEGTKPKVEAPADPKAKRAERFGLVSDTLVEEAKTKRAARFGLPVSSPASANGSQPKPSKSQELSAEEQQKILERAKRFGLPLEVPATVTQSAGGAKGKKRSGPTDEVLQARAKRFGGEVSGGGEMDEKKKARLARFGGGGNGDVAAT